MLWHTRLAPDMQATETLHPRMLVTRASSRKTDMHHLQPRQAPTQDLRTSTCHVGTQSFEATWSVQLSWNLTCKPRLYNTPPHCNFQSPYSGIEYEHAVDKDLGLGISSAELPHVPLVLSSCTSSSSSELSSLLSSNAAKRFPRTLQSTELASLSQPRRSRALATICTARRRPIKLPASGPTCSAAKAPITKSFFKPPH